jgi:homoserine kinase
MDFALHIHARESNGYSIDATGRNVAQCGDVSDSLVLETYRNVLAGQGLDPVPLHLDLKNEIPLGMGCGSSAAALVAGVALASHFGGLKWSAERVMSEASLLEGHPDNVAACVLGGLTVSSMVTAEGGPSVIDALSITPVADWPLLVVMPEASLSTKKARALLPESYSKADAIANVQAVSLLVAAFAQGRGDLLARAMRDRMHQPYRQAACPLLAELLPFSGENGVLGVALSGAGPSVLMVLESAARTEIISETVRKTLSDARMVVEIFVTRISSGFEGF